MTRTIYVVHAIDEAGIAVMIAACSTLAGAMAIVARDVPDQALTWRREPPLVEQELERHVAGVLGGVYSVGRWELEL